MGLGQSAFWAATLCNMRGDQGPSVNAAAHAKKSGQGGLKILD